jgi:Fur family transcriptional regulator, peroxide stress response regulator
VADPQLRFDQMVKVLKGKGHRLTPQRLAVLKILAESKGHPSVESIFEMVKAHFPTTSLATVYNTINLLKTEKEVLELGFAHLGSRYDGNKPHSHPHAICTACGRIVDPECGSLMRLTEEMARQTGFHLTHHQICFFGLCPECQKGK